MEEAWRCLAGEGDGVMVDGELQLGGAAGKQEHVFSGGHGLMVQGYKPLIEALSEGLDIRLDHMVTKIAQRCNRVIVSVEDIGVGNENKVALRFSNVFWPGVEVLGVAAPRSYACGYFLNLHKATRNPVLVYMAAGRFADDLEKLSDEEAVNFVMLQLEKILPHASRPTQYLVSRWGSDIDSLGSYFCVWIWCLRCSSCSYLYSSCSRFMPSRCLWECR